MSASAAHRAKIPASAGALAFGLRDVLQLHRRLSCFYTREQFKKLPLEWVATPCLDAPLLVFDAFGDPAQWVDTWSGRGMISSLELDEIRGDAIAYRRATDGDKRALLAKRIRRRWSALCDRATGYAFADLPDSIFHFREE